MIEDPQPYDADPSVLADLVPIWWLFDREPEMDNIMEQAGDSLQDMINRLQVMPFRDTEGDQRLFLARFELPKYQSELQFPDSIFAKSETGEDAYGFIDFLGGFPLECCEMLTLLGQYSTKPETIQVVPGEGSVAPPVPMDFFAGWEKDKILLNYLYLAADFVQWLAQNLGGEPDPNNLHFWLRCNLTGMDKKWPTPGEFVGLGVRIMPDLPWGEQDSSPFIYAGNWLDTVFYTTGYIKNIIPPSNERAFPIYEVQWRKDVIQAISTDFAQYKVDDHVAIIKDISVEKQSQLWKDADMKNFDQGMWHIAPITFYEGQGA